VTVIEYLVVDASVGLKWVLAEPGADRARALLEAVAHGEIRLLAPDVYVAEISNVLWKRSRLRGELSPDDAREALDRLLGSLPEIVPGAVLSSQALELAIAFGHPAYDCLYVALALRAGCPLVTADRSLVRTFAPATGQVLHLDDYAVPA
jgi:predicted nucleic acid-binding protein